MSCYQSLNGALKREGEAIQCTVMKPASKGNTSKVTRSLKVVKAELRSSELPSNKSAMHKGNNTRR